jgi:hypothetical protein
MVCLEILNNGSHISPLLLSFSTTITMTNRYSDRQPYQFTFGGWLQSGVALLLTSIALHQVIRQSTAPELGTVDLGAIESGSMTQDNYYATVSGYADQTIAKSTRKNKLTQTETSTPHIYIPLHQTDRSTTPVSLIISVQEDRIDKYIRVDPTTNQVTVKGHVTTISSTSAKTWLQEHGVIVSDNVKYIIPSVDKQSAASGIWLICIIGSASTIGLFKRRTITLGWFQTKK